MKIIDEVNNGVNRKKDIASEFGILVSILSTILKDKDTILKKQPVYSYLWIIPTYPLVT